MKTAKSGMTKACAELRPAIVLLVIMGVLTGLIYPLCMQTIGRFVFPSRAEGSILLQDGQPVGSKLIGQAFDAPDYFLGRPSATTPGPNNALASGGANMGSTNPALIDAVRARINALKQASQRHGKSAAGGAAIPVDLVTASASGLDPDISPAAAYYQVARVAKVRGLSQTRMKKLIEEHTQGRQFGFLGEPRVNVLELNLALDALQNAVSEKE